MANFAVLNENNQIVNVVVADNLETASLITEKTCVAVPANTFLNIGWYYLEGQFVRDLPEPVEVVENTNKID